MRRIVFWVHLALGVLCGLVVAMLCFTGAVLGFEREIVAWADGSVAADGPPRSIDDLVASVDTGGQRITSITWKPNTQLYVSFGREARWVDPSTGKTSVPRSAGIRRFFGTVEGIHRSFGGEGGRRKLGTAVTGACTIAFFVMGLTGLWLWFPRKWRRAGAVFWFRRGLDGKARDFNWHNVLGFWMLPILLVLAGTGVVMGYRWASDAVYRLAGEAPPKETKPPAIAKGDTPPLSLEELFARAHAEAPGARAITLRMAPPTAPVTFSVKDHLVPAFAARTVQLDPYTGDVLKSESWDDVSRGRRARVWIRFLHTGQAFGLVGEALATLACLAALVLVWTGSALSVRRFVAYRRRR